MVEIMGYILLVLAPIAKALQDHCKINSFPQSWTWWNEKTSWTIKDNMENWITGRQIDWLEWLFHTVLVWVTDGWHFWQLVWKNALIFGICAIMVSLHIKWYWIGLVVSAFFSILFEITYSYILKPLLK